MVKIFIIILNWNGKNYISNCLKSAVKLEKNSLKLQIVVVDNGSTDGSDKSIEKNFPQIKVIRNKTNLGFTGGNNVGLRYVLNQGADAVLMLNSDTIVDKRLVVLLVKALAQDKNIGIIGPKIYFAPGYEYHKKKYKPAQSGKVFWYAGGIVDWADILLSHRGVDEVDEGQYDTQAETDFVSGCCMLIKREVLEKVSLLDDRYFLYLEDVDFCQRAKVAGYKIVYTPETKLWHLNAGSSAVGGNLHDYFITRNRLLFGMQYASFRTKFALLRESLRLLFNGRKWQRIGIRDFFMRKFNKGSWQADK